MRKRLGFEPANADLQQCSRHDVRAVGPVRGRRPLLHRGGKKLRRHSLMRITGLGLALSDLQLFDQAIVSL